MSEESKLKVGDSVIIIKSDYPININLITEVVDVDPGLSSITVNIEGRTVITMPSRVKKIPLVPGNPVSFITKDLERVH